MNDWMNLLVSFIAGGGIVAVVISHLFHSDIKIKKMDIKEDQRKEKEERDKNEKLISDEKTTWKNSLQEALYNNCVSTLE